MTNKPVDPFDLQRFMVAQEGVYGRALSEIQAGVKRSHWMWFVFPQFEGLGNSPTARRFAIKSVAEARAYLAHPVLGKRLNECAAALLAVDGRSATQIFGFPDDLKLRSCMTLFARVDATGIDSLFEQVLAKYYAGRPDEKTLCLIADAPFAQSPIPNPQSPI